MSQISSRMPLVYALKAVASQLIVLHHLSFYGPMSDVAAELLPDLFTWLSRYGRFAVQIFLVTAGFLAARSFSLSKESLLQSPLSRLAKRYVRLVLPYAVAMVFAVIGVQLASLGMVNESIPAPPTFWQVLAHLLLIQSVLGYDSLSAGVWYVAIDFQLFAVMLLVLWLSRRLQLKSFVGASVVLGLGVASLLFFNRDDVWDDFFIYFFAAYAMGAAAYWISELKTDKLVWLGFSVLTLVVVIGLCIDFRSRLALALVTSGVLGVSARSGLLYRWPQSQVLAFLGKISYSVFLIHFPVCLMVNALFAQLAPESAWVNLFGILFAWGASVGCGALLFYGVERRVSWK